MPVAVSYPGVYVEEVPSGVRTITGVATSITAFIGRALRGPLDEPVMIFSYGGFEREFGGLWQDSALGYAVRDFYLNGGSRAIVVRVFKPDSPTATGKAGAANAAAKFALAARSAGEWGGGLRFTVDTRVAQSAAEALGRPNTDGMFNLTLFEVAAGGAVVRSEQFRNLTAIKDFAPRRVDKVLAAESRLADWKDAWNDASLPDFSKVRTAEQNVDKATKDLADELAAPSPDSGKIDTAFKALLATQDALAAEAMDDVQRAEQVRDASAKALAELLRTPTPDPVKKKAAEDKLAADTAKVATATDKVKGSNGQPLTKDQFTPALGEMQKKGINALDLADLLNLLCIPPYLADGGVDSGLVAEAAAYCERRRAMLLVDPQPGWRDAAAAIAGLPAVGTSSKNAALFFPRLMQADPLRDNQVNAFAPCGAVAGIFARTDTQRGVWKAPAGQDATLVGVPQLSVQLSDGEIGQLNPLGVNCLRSLPAAGRVVWGARTLQGDDRLASEWKYIPVRRTALYIEESLYRGTQWVVFEPNDEPLWAQIRLNVGAFMNNLFRQGAFQGKTAQQAYFVKCDKETTTQADIDLGVVNIAVGFAPLKPAEFVIIRLQQIAGRIEA
jgi:phage tail sheath protein FI